MLWGFGAGFVPVANARTLGGDAELALPTHGVDREYPSPLLTNVKRAGSFGITDSQMPFVTAGSALRNGIAGGFVASTTVRCEKQPKYARIPRRLGSLYELGALGVV